MARIKINTDGLRQNRNALDGKINELQLLNARLDSLLAAIESSWDGVASRQYIGTMTRQKQKAKEMVGVLQEFRNYMDQATERFEHQDKSSAAKIRSC